MIYVKCKLLTEQYVFEVYQCMALISFDKQYICYKAICKPILVTILINKMLWEKHFEWHMLYLGLDNTIQVTETDQSWHEQI